MKTQGHVSISKAAFHQADHFGGHEEGFCMNGGHRLEGEVLSLDSFGTEVLIEVPAHLLTHNPDRFEQVKCASPAFKIPRRKSVMFLSVTGKHLRRSGQQVGGDRLLYAIGDLKSGLLELLRRERVKGVICLKVLSERLL